MPVTDAELAVAVLSLDRLEASGDAAGPVRVSREKDVLGQLTRGEPDVVLALSGGECDAGVRVGQEVVPSVACRPSQPRSSGEDSPGFSRASSRTRTVDPTDARQGGRPAVPRPAAAPGGGAPGPTGSRERREERHQGEACGTARPLAVTDRDPRPGGSRAAVRGLAPARRWRMTPTPPPTGRRLRLPQVADPDQAISGRDEHQPGRPVAISPVDLTTPMAFTASPGSRGPR